MMLSLSAMEQKEPRVSVVIPTYKPADYIKECLWSLAAQTLDKDDYSVVVVLNGCREPWCGMLSELLEEIRDKSGMNVKLIVNEWGNVSNARNIGIESCDSEYVCFVDDDDYVSPCYLERLLAKAGRDTVSLCRPYAFADGNNAEEIPHRITDDWNRYHAEGKVRFSIPKRFFDGPCMKMLHRDIIGDRRFDTRFRNGEDSIFMFLISDRIKWADFTDDDAVYYRRMRDGSAQCNLRDWKRRPATVWNKVRMYTRYIMAHPFSYNWCFYLSRLRGAAGTLING